MKKPQFKPKRLKIIKPNVKKKEIKFIFMNTNTLFVQECVFIQFSLIHFQLLRFNKIYLLNNDTFR